MYSPALNSDVDVLARVYVFAVVSFILCHLFCFHFLEIVAFVHSFHIKYQLTISYSRSFNIFSWNFSIKNFFSAYSWNWRKYICYRIACSLIRLVICDKYGLNVCRFVFFFFRPHFRSPIISQFVWIIITEERSFFLRSILHIFMTQSFFFATSLSRFTYFMAEKEMTMTIANKFN